MKPKPLIRTYLSEIRAMCNAIEVTVDPERLPKNFAEIERIARRAKRQALEGWDEN